MRVQESLVQRRRVLSDAETAKIVSFAANVNEEGLGLSKDEYATILQEVTDVIHVRIMSPRLWL